MFCDSNCYDFVVSCLFWSLLRDSLCVCSGLLQSTLQTKLELQRMTWGKWPKGKGQREQEWMGRNSNHSASLTLGKKREKGVWCRERLSLPCSSTSLRQAYSNLWGRTTCSKSLALSQKGSALGCPTPITSTLAWSGLRESVAPA